MYFYCVIVVVGLQVITMPMSTIGLDCQCGKPFNNETSMNGERAPPHYHPWVVVVMKNDKVWCIGTMITNKHVLSAGHCFIWEILEMMEVLIGIDDLDNLPDATRLNITSVVVHENFTSDPTRDENDVAIATLARPVDFGDTISPVCLPNPGEEFSSLVGTVVGWGVVGVKAEKPKVLRVAQLRIFSDDECLRSELMQELTPEMMCAAFDGIDTCSGDSGGPLLVLAQNGRYVEAGITSWGLGCGDLKYPGVYTNVSYFVEWIKTHTKDGLTCD